MRYREIGVEHRRLVFGLKFLIHGIVAVGMRAVRGLEYVGLLKEIEFPVTLCIERIGYKEDVFPNDANRDVTIIIHRKGNIEALRTGL